MVRQIGGVEAERDFALRAPGPSILAQPPAYGFCGSKLGVRANLKPAMVEQLAELAAGAGRNFDLHDLPLVWPPTGDPSPAA